MSRVKSVVFMFVITFCFSAVVSGVKFANDDRIERNQLIKLQGIVLNVLKITEPGKISDEALVKTFENRIEEIQAGDKTVYIGYEEDKRTIRGYAFPVGGAGFWGPIDGMVAVDPDASKIMGIAFYKHTETPGLGGRISEAWFQKQFEGLPVYPIEGDKKIFYLKPAGSSQAPNQLQAITGASRTSAAVQTFLNRELDRFLTELWEPVKVKKS